MQNYTDPTSGYTFRSLKPALSYLKTGEIPNRATIQKTSVHDLYSFDKSADLVIIISNRKKLCFYLHHVVLFVPLLVLLTFHEKSVNILFLFSQLFELFYIFLLQNFIFLFHAHDCRTMSRIISDGSLL
jgi:hypothetical protein